MGPVHRTRVSLGFFGEELDPAEVSILLGVPPTSSTSKGASWTTPSGDQRVAKTGSWRLTSAEAEGDLTAQIKAIFASTSNDVAAWQALSAKFSGRLFCGLFMQEGNEGLRLEPSTLAAIAERDLFLDLDIYGPDVDEINQSAVR